MITDVQRRAFKYTVFENEGGDKYTDDPADSGGPTKYGITLRTLSAWRSPKNVTADDVKALTENEAIDIYVARYWIAAGCDRITAFPIALALFDMSVVMGPNTAVLWAQMGINACLTATGMKPLIAEDGKPGPSTFGWLSRIPPSTFLAAYVDLLLKRIDHIIQLHPKDERFRHGWETRIKRLLSL